MTHTFKSVLAVAAIVLIGAGCPSAAPIQELPTTPPTPEVMEKKDDGATMEKKEEEAVMEKKEEGVMMKKEPEVMDKDEKMIKADLKPYYIAYTSDGAKTALSEGRVTLLYFFAAWCPICRVEDPNIKSWIEGSGLPVAGFRVNYDTESSLKSQYKIPYQHTTVILNTKGEETQRFSGPMTQAELLAALKKASQ
jgi:thiol-disulfide isomerase/thioredoxin